MRNVTEGDNDNNDDGNYIESTKVNTKNHVKK